METLNYLPIKRTAVEEGLWLQMQSKINEIKKQMGDKYILAKKMTKNEML